VLHINIAVQMKQMVIIRANQAMHAVVALHAMSPGG